MTIIFNFTNQEASTLASACKSFKQTMQADNQRGRDELDQLSERLKDKQSLNPLGTDFTIIKQALRDYRKTDQSPIVDQLLTRFKGIC